MGKIAKLNEYSKEEIKRQFTNGKIDTDFMCEYISLRDKVYNQLIDEVNNLTEENKELRIQVSAREEVANKNEEVIEEIRKKLKLERKIALPVNQNYTVSVIDSVLQILDKGENI